MLHLTYNDLHQLRGAGGERFTEFIDRLLLATAARHGLPLADIRTQLRTNIPDGGVDTQIKQPIQGNNLGWFGSPTCWQYKAREGSTIDNNKLIQEIHKPYVEKLIREGYAYRLCILGDPMPQKIEEWESLLERESRSINPDAPPPKVISGGAICSWAEKYPAVMACFRNLNDRVLHWEAWEQSCHAITPHYVANDKWNYSQTQISQHVGFPNECIGGEVCLAVCGAAGVGKTRLVFETLKKSASAPGLVLYAADESEAKKVAFEAANSHDSSLILVADECSSTTMYFLNENLRAAKDRIRIICIDNAAPPLGSKSSQIWLLPDQLTNTQDILAANFPEVPQDRRYQYVELAGGFVRLAADMCNHDAEIARGDMSFLSTVEAYVRHRIPRNLRPLIALVALFHKVGFRDDVAEDVEALCQIAGRNKYDFREAMRHLKESPGFVVQAGRYWYVSPEIVSRVLFEEGWKCWVHDDFREFMQKVPSNLFDQFCDCAGKLGSEEVRAQLSAYFRAWFGDLTIDNLAVPSVASRVAAIVETSPQEYLPYLCAIIESGSPEDIKSLVGFSLDAKWGARRTLVWLLENLVSFPELFNDCEKCLFRLARFETEPNIGNNATAIWRDLFGVYLSGTATPFSSRLTVLAKRLAGSDETDSLLACQGLAEIFSITGGKLVRRPVVAGRLRPPDWRPSSGTEELACYREALDLCMTNIISRSSLLRSHVFSVLANSIFFLLSKGLFVDLRSKIALDTLTDSEKRVLVNEVDEFLRHFEETRRGDSDYLKSVKEWVDLFRPEDFDGQLRSVCSRDVWDRRFSADSKTPDEMTDITERILREPQLLKDHLEWLGTPEGKSAEILGFRLGERDHNLVCAGMIFNHAALRCDAPLARGYVRGMTKANRSPNEEILKILDAIEEKCPEAAIDLLSYGGDGFDALERAKKLVSSDTLPVSHLAVFAMGVGRRELSVEEISELIPYFTQAAQHGDTVAATAGIRFIETRLSFEERRDYGRCLENEKTRDSVWTLLESAIPSVVGQHSRYEWAAIMRVIAHYSAKRSIAICCAALCSENLSIGSVAKDLLQELADVDAVYVMDGIGESLLNKEKGWRLQIDVLRDIIAKMPEGIVLNWVRSHGLQGAKVIARHLPYPFIDDAGNAIVPSLLDSILREFDEDSVLSAFAAGMHSGESWWGNAADRFRAEAEAARAFLVHNNPRIREWAKYEIAHLHTMADREEQIHAERFLPD